MMFTNTTMNNRRHQCAAAATATSVPAWAAAPGVDAASCYAVHRPILAERFRTKMCNNFVERGACPYVHRCMFAHGDAELRTSAQNVADRLFSEDAIRAFKRFHYENTKVCTGATDCCFTGNSALRSAMSTPPPSMYNESASTTSPKPSRRRNDPYAAKSEWHPLADYQQSPATRAQRLPCCSASGHSGSECESMAPSPMAMLPAAMLSAAL